MALSKIETDFKSKAITGAFAAMLITTPMAANADNGVLTQYSQPTTYSAPQNIQKKSAVELASEFADEHINNISIIVYYGEGNGNTPDEFGSYAVKLLQNEAKKEGKDLNIRYFITNLPKGEKGVVLGFDLGDVGYGPVDMAKLFDSENTIMADVLNRRDAAHNLLNN
jgi:hypothetical protein